MIKNRLLSILLDLILSISFFIFIVNYACGVLIEYKYAPLSFIIYYSIFDIIFCTSPGKWLVNLKIIQTGNYDINKRLLILTRSIFKIFTIFTIIGIVINIISILSEKYSWYDKVLGLSVVDTKKGELTSTQKAWRKHFKNQ